MQYTFREYLESAKSTVLIDKERLSSYSLMGLSGEVGELANLMKKVTIRDVVFPKWYRILKSLGIIRLLGKMGFHWYCPILPREKISDECGDVMWYLFIFMDSVGLDPADVAMKNAQKLKARKASGALHGHKRDGHE